MLGNAIMRLLREKWKTAYSLAEELYAILQDDVPLEHSGPITIGNTDGSAPLNIRVPQFSDIPAVNFVRGDGTSVGSIYLDSDSGEMTFGGTSFSSNYSLLAKKAVKAKEAERGGGGGSAPGTVVSGGGTSYLVEIFADANKSISLGTVPVAQGSGSSDFPVPAGTSVVVHIDANGAYFMQAPVWQ